ncbi:MAG: DUF4186 domain-containing protein [Hyphomicrobiaceae bacterium]|nr:DUF4186 domain-containing protein [Hyphomicrobiaceae bacterium]
MAITNRILDEDAAPATPVSLDGVFDALGRSPFRRRCGLAAAERAYLERKGLAVVLRHARDFIDRRLAPRQPPNDGRQTPFRGHPAFVAQHATATCCRCCLAKWHRIPRGHALTEPECQYVVAVIERWLRGQARQLHRRGRS